MNLLRKGGAVALAGLFVIALASCQTTETATTAAGRKIHTLKTESGTITCVEPGADVVANSSKSKVSFAAKTIDELVSGAISSEIGFQRIRDLSIETNDFEVLDFRLCIQYGNRIISGDQYTRLLQVLRRASGAPEAQSPETQSRFDIDVHDIKFIEVAEEKVRVEVALRFRPTTTTNREIASVFIGLAVIHDEAKIDAGVASFTTSSCEKVPSCLGYRLFDLSTNPAIVRGGTPGTLHRFSFDVPKTVKTIRVWWEFYQREAMHNSRCEVDKNKIAPPGGIPFLKVVGPDGKDQAGQGCFRATDREVKRVTF